jgi:hypothetical protein
VPGRPDVVSRTCIVAPPPDTSTHVSNVRVRLGVVMVNTPPSATNVPASSSEPEPDTLQSHPERPPAAAVHVAVGTDMRNKPWSVLHEMPTPVLHCDGRFTDVSNVVVTRRVTLLPAKSTRPDNTEFELSNVTALHDCRKSASGSSPHACV